MLSKSSQTEIRPTGSHGSPLKCMKVQLISECAETLDTCVCDSLIRSFIYSHKTMQKSKVKNSLLPHKDPKCWQLPMSQHREVSFLLAHINVSLGKSTQCQPQWCYPILSQLLSVLPCRLFCRYSAIYLWLVVQVWCTSIPWYPVDNMIIWAA